MVIFEVKAGRKGIISGKSAFWKACFCVVITIFFLYTEVIAYKEDEFLAKCQALGHLTDIDEKERQKMMKMDGLIHTWPGMIAVFFSLIVALNWGQFLGIF